MSQFYCVRPARPAIAALVTVALVVPPHIWAQTKPPEPVRTQGLSTVLPPLKIFVLAGQGAVNFIPDQRATTPVVEVRDENDVPMEGVVVRFDLPATGPGGVFPDGQHVLTAKTNLQGQAAAPFIMNAEQGRFEIAVTVTVADRTARAVISQMNSLTPAVKLAQHKTPWYLNWKYLVIIGAAATAGIVFAARAGSSQPKIVITPGTPTFSGPQ
jgi:hypothetical protein